MVTNVLITPQPWFPTLTRGTQVDAQTSAQATVTVGELFGPKSCPGPSLVQDILPPTISLVYRWVLARRLEGIRFLGGGPSCPSWVIGSILWHLGHLPFGAVDCACNLVVL